MDRLSDKKDYFDVEEEEEEVETVKPPKKKSTSSEEEEEEEGLREDEKEFKKSEKIIDKFVKNDEYMEAMNRRYGVEPSQFETASRSFNKKLWEERTQPQKILGNDGVYYDILKIDMGNFTTSNLETIDKTLLNPLTTKLIDKRLKFLKGETDESKIFIPVGEMFKPKYKMICGDVEDDFEINKDIKPSLDVIETENERIKEKVSTIDELIKSTRESKLEDTEKQKKIQELTDDRVFLSQEKIKNMKSIEEMIENNRKKNTNEINNAISVLQEKINKYKLDLQDEDDAELRLMLRTAEEKRDCLRVLKGELTEKKFDQFHSPKQPESVINIELQTVDDYCKDMFKHVNILQSEANRRASLLNPYREEIDEILSILIEQRENKADESISVKDDIEKLKKDTVLYATEEGKKKEQYLNLKLMTLESELAKVEKEINDKQNSEKLPPELKSVNDEYEALSDRIQLFKVRTEMFCPKDMFVIFQPEELQRPQSIFPKLFRFKPISRVEIQKMKVINEKTILKDEDRFFLVEQMFPIPEGLQGKALEKAKAEQQKNIERIERLVSYSSYNFNDIQWMKKTLNDEEKVKKLQKFLKSKELTRQEQQTRYMFYFKRTYTEEDRKLKSALRQPWGQYGRRPYFTSFKNKQQKRQLEEVLQLESIIETLSFQSKDKDKLDEILDKAFPKAVSGTKSKFDTSDESLEDEKQEARLKLLEIIAMKNATENLPDEIKDWLNQKFKGNRLQVKEFIDEMKNRLSDYRKMKAEREYETPTEKRQSIIVDKNDKLQELKEIYEKKKGSHTIIIGETLNEFDDKLLEWDKTVEKKARKEVVNDFIEEAKTKRKFNNAVKNFNNQKAIVEAHKEEMEKLDREIRKLLDKKEEIDRKNKVTEGNEPFLQEDELKELLKKRKPFSEESSLLHKFEMDKIAYSSPKELNDLVNKRELLLLKGEKASDIEMGNINWELKNKRLAILKQKLKDKKKEVREKTDIDF